MLIEHDAVEAKLVAHDVVLEVLVVETTTFSRIEVTVRKHQRGSAEIEARLRRICRHWLLGKIHEMHDNIPPSRDIWDWAALDSCSSATGTRSARNSHGYL